MSDDPKFHGLAVFFAFNDADNGDQYSEDVMCPLLREYAELIETECPGPPAGFLEDKENGNRIYWCNTISAVADRIEREFLRIVVPEDQHHHFKRYHITGDRNLVNEQATEISRLKSELRFRDRRIEELEDRNKKHEAGYMRLKWWARIKVLFVGRL